MDLKARHTSVVLFIVRTFIQNLLEFDIPHTLPVAESRFLGHKVVKFLKNVVECSQILAGFQDESSNYLIHGSYQASPVDIFLTNTFGFIHVATALRQARWWNCWIYRFSSHQQRVYF